MNEEEKLKKKSLIWAQSAHIMTHSSRHMERYTRKTNVFLFGSLSYFIVAVVHNKRLFTTHFSCFSLSL